VRVATARFTVLGFAFAVHPADFFSVEPIGQGLSNSLYFIRRLTPSSGSMFAVKFDRRRSKDGADIDDTTAREPSAEIAVLRKFGQDLSVFIKTDVERFVFRTLAERSILLATHQNQRSKVVISF
jgi:hypothetical protein